MREFKIFLLTEFVEEEQYLRQKAKEGFKFQKVNLPGFYHFTESEPEDMVYRIDFNPQGKEEKERYIQLFEDYGWEYMQDLNEFSYFRKLAENIEDEDLEIFSDKESRLAMLNRILMKRIIPLFIIFLLCLFQPNELTVAIVILYAYVFIRFGIGYKKLLTRE